MKTTKEQKLKEECNELWEMIGDEVGSSTIDLIVDLVKLEIKLSELKNK